MSRQGESPPTPAADSEAAAPAPVAGLPPAPPPGSMTADLASDTDDPVILQQRLTRARQRLGFYETFDRIIQENIRRSGELMLESITLREQAQTQASEAIENRAARDRRLAEREEQQRRILSDLLTDIERSRASLATLGDRVQSALYELHGVPLAESDRSPDPAPTPTAAPPQSASPVAPASPPDVEVGVGVMLPEPVPAVVEVAPVAQATDAAPRPADESRTVEVLVHGVPRAAVALSLQRHLGTLAHVVTVEAREFAEGVLRLQVTSIRPLGAPDIAGWDDGAGGNVLRADPTVLELELPDADNRDGR